MYMNFIDWMRTTSKRKKKQTYDMYWRRLCIYFSLLAEREMSNNVMKQMRRVSILSLRVHCLSLTCTVVYQHSPACGRRHQRPAQTEAHYECRRPWHPSPPALAVYGTHTSRPSAPAAGFCPAGVLVYRHSTPHPRSSQLNSHTTGKHCTRSSGDRRQGLQKPQKSRWISERHTETHPIR